MAKLHEKKKIQGKKTRSVVQSVSTPGTNKDEKLSLQNENTANAI